MEGTLEIGCRIAGGGYIETTFASTGIQLAELLHDLPGFLRIGIDPGGQAVIVLVPLGETDVMDEEELLQTAVAGLEGVHAGLVVHIVHGFCPPIYVSNGIVMLGVTIFYMRLAYIVKENGNIWSHKNSFPVFVDNSYALLLTPPLQDRSTVGFQLLLAHIDNCFQDFAKLLSFYIQERVSSQFDGYFQGIVCGIDEGNTLDQIDWCCNEVDSAGSRTVTGDGTV